MKKLHTNILLLGFCLLFSTAWVQAEGTQQVAPDPNSIVMLEVNRDDFGNFAAAGGPEKSRLYIRIEDPSEVVYLGFSVEYNQNGQPFTAPTSHYRFRIRRVDSLSTINPTVHGPFTVRDTSANVSSWAEAQYGVYPVTEMQNGNLMYVFQPTQAGDYYIEFEDITNLDNNKIINIGFWDITVADDNDNAIDGRVWSRNWAFRTPPVTPNTLPECQWSQEFQGSFYTYTSDGFVSKIDFAESGFQGLSFNVAFNSTGPGDSGDLVVDRRSVQGANATANAAEHQVFLTPPDPNAFPSSTNSCGQITSSSSFRCVDDGFCLEVEVTKPGQVEVIIDFNQNGVFDPNTLDVSVVQDFPDSLLANCIEWDGLRGDSTPVAFGDTVNLIFIYSQGIQHYSAYDVEFLKNGFCVETIRPVCPSPLSSNELYWDDSNITDAEPGTGQPQVQLNGCECGVDGCRTWNNFDVNDTDCNILDSQTTGYGDKSTLNTWWFANIRETIAADIPVIACMIEGPDTVCTGTPVSYEAIASGSTAPYTYTWTGPDGFSATSQIITDLTVPGEYCVTITGSLGCQTTCCKTLTIDDEAGPEVVYPSVVEVCSGEPTLIPSTGDTSGLTFIWTPSVGLDDVTIANPTVTVDSDIEYTVTVIPANPFCAVTYTVSIEVIDDPMPDFSFSVDCDGVTVSFTNESTNATTYVWDFGDPTTDADTSTAENPTYTYPSLGTYTVTLTAINGGICSEIFTTDITLSGIVLLADFSVDYLNCTPDSVVVQFTDQSTSSSSPIVDYDYQINPGGLSSDDPNPVFSFTSDQTITVTYTVTNADNCPTSIERDLDIFLGPPNDQFPDSLTVCPGESVSPMPGGDAAYVYSWSPTTGIDDPSSATPTFSPTETTTYTVTVSSIGADTCTVIETLVAFVPPAINLAVNGGGQTCMTQTTLTASADTDVDFLWSDGTVGPTLTVDVSGTVAYTVTATDIYDCSESVTVTVAGGPVDVDIPDTLAVCLGAGEIELFVTNLDPNDTLTYAWTPANLFVPGTENTANPDFIELIGEQTVFVTVSNQFGCDLTDTVQTAVFDPTAMLSFTSEVQCDGATVDFTNTSTNAFAYLWIFGDGTSSTEEEPSHTYSEAGTYTVTLTVVYDVDCVDEFSTSVTVQDPQVVADFTFSIIECTAAGALIQFMDNSTNTFNNTVGYSWTFMDAVPAASSDQNPQVLAPDGDLIVSFTIETANDCDATFVDTIQIITTDINLPDTVFVCPDGSTVLNPDGDEDLLYNWSPATGLSATDVASPTVTPLETTTYFVTVTGTGDNPCMSFDTTVVTFFEPIDPMLPDTVLACSDEPTPLNPSPNTNWTYAWAPDDNLNDSNSPNPLFTAVGPATINYMVTVTDENGCDVVEEVLVIVSPDLMLSVSPADTNLCNTAPLTLTANSPVGGVTYTWFANNLSNPIATGATTTVNPVEGTNTYFVIATDGQGCADTLSTTATVQDLETGLPADTVFVCESAPTPLNPNGDPSLEYVWSPEDNLDFSVNGVHNPIVTVSSSAVYFVTITDPVFMCDVLDTVYVELYGELPDPMLADTILACSGEATPLNPEPNTDWTYSWSPVDNLDNPNSPNPNFTAIGPASFTYSVTVTDENGCEGFDEVLVLVSPDLMLSVSPADTNLCNTAPLTISADSPVDDVTFTWYEGDLTNEIGTGSSIMVMPMQGTNNYFVIATDLGGCADTLSSTAIVQELDTGLPPDTVFVCENVPTPLNPNGDPDLEYDWSPEDNLDLMTIGAHNPLVSVVEPAVYFVTITDPTFMCTVLDTVYVEVLDDPTGAITTADTILCETAPIPLEATGDATDFDWYDNPDCAGDPVAMGASTTVTPPLGTTVYYLKLTNEAGCEELVDSVQVDNYPLQVSITPPQVSCEPLESVTLEIMNDDPSQILTIVWDPLGVDPTTGPVVTADPNVTDTFSATVTNQFGCTTTLSTTVDVVDLSNLSIEAEPDTTTLGNSTIITVSGCDDCTYTWDVPNGDIDPEDGPVVTATPSAGGLLTYTVTVERLGCEEELSISILVLEAICDPEHVFLPNAFTPNGDGNNDVLRLRSAFLDDILEMELLIYDRWGEEMFRTTDPSAGWDGMYRNERLPPDVYGFYLRVVCPDEQELIQKGNITILR